MRLTAFPRVRTVLAIVGGFVASTLCPPTDAAVTNSVRVILIGDSTVAARNGYGDALCGLFRPNVSCINLARNGRSSGSFRAEGWWDQAMLRLRAREPYATTWVLIQFGHNDQPGKPGRSTDLVTEYPMNLARYVDEVRLAGANPVLVTPLTRRVFRHGKLQNDLAPWAEAMRSVAEKNGTPLLDLNADSAAAVSAMGPGEADTLAEVPPHKSGPAPPATPLSSATAETRDATLGETPPKFDYTHLGHKGAAFFARIVAREIVHAVPAMAAHLTRDKPVR